MQKVLIAICAFVALLVTICDASPFGAVRGEQLVITSPCPRDLALSDGNIIYDPVIGDLFSGSTATHQCSSGFRLEGDLVRTCQEDGTWSGVAPSCIRASTSCTQQQGTIECRSARLVLNESQTVGRSYSYVHVCPKDSSSLLCFYSKLRRCCPGELEGGSLQCASSTTLNFNGEDVKVLIHQTTSGDHCIAFDDAHQNTIGRCCDGQKELDSCEGICRRDLTLTNGIVAYIPTTGDLVPGSTATHRCDPGYVLVGVSVRNCQADGTWSGVPPTCEPIQPICPRELTLTNGIVAYIPTTGDLVPGSTASHQCDPGYVLVGVSVRNCQADGTWSGVPPTCEPLVCPRELTLTNGIVAYIPTTGDLVPGSTASHQCDPGYVLVGVSVRNCQADGTWSGVPPTCEPIVCPRELTLTNGIVAYIPTTGDLVPGSTASHQCDPGYVLVGVSVRNCQADGTWSGVPPTCEPIVCPRELTLTNGIVAYIPTTGDLVPGSTASHQCDPGYVLVGVSVRNCQADGTWSGVPPTCEPIVCPRELTLTNGIVSYIPTTGDLVPGSTATHQCDPGYVLVGVSVRNCQADGTWNGVPPTCEPIVCPRELTLTNGIVAYIPTTGDLVPGSTATHRCDPGYVLVGVSVRNCQADGTWSGVPPTCEPIVCPRELTLTNGIVDYIPTIGDLVPGSTATHQCDPGYVLVGVSVRNCQADGTWSGVPPTCEPIVCPRELTLTNGIVAYIPTIGDLVPGSTATHQCDPGYVLVGVSVRNCQADGTWSGVPPTCEPIVCPRELTLTNGIVDYIPTTGDLVPGSIATHQCNPGYELVGVSVRNCQADGTWSGVPPTCEPIVCPRELTLTNGIVAYIPTTGDLVPGSTATHQCDPGYVLVGVSVRNCQADGTWSGVPPTCEPRGCPPLPSISGISISYSPIVVDIIPDYYIVGTSATHECSDPREDLNGTHVRVCQSDGTWSGQPPTCSCPPRCPPLPLDPRLIITYDPDITEDAADYHNVGTTATYECPPSQPPALLEGNPVRTCESNGLWSGVAPVCRFPEPITCQRDLTLSDGSITYDPAIGDLLPGSTATHRCNPGYELVGVSVRTCQGDETWNGLPPTCQPLPPPCVPQRDIYFILDSTDSVGDDIFCRFGYALQAIVAGINQSGKEGPRVATILLHHSGSYRTTFLFELDESCDTIVNDNITQVVYEYHAVGLDPTLPTESLQYPNVRASNTFGASAVKLSSDTIAANAPRPASLIILTDGKFSDLPTVKSRVRALIDDGVNVIAAGIGPSNDIDEETLRDLVSETVTENAVYEENRNNVLSFLTRIVERMRATGALCTDQADEVRNSLQVVTSDIQEYCESCMWKLADSRNLDELHFCSEEVPQCGSGGPGVMMQQGSRSANNHGGSVDSWWRKLKQRMSDLIFSRD